MGLKRNIFASYLNQGYTTVVSMVAVPYYIRYMGAEAYGLVGFFVMLQAWFMLLDVGLTPTVARETARHNGTAVAADEFVGLIRGLEFLFAAVALLGCGILYLSADWLSTHWLKLESVSRVEVQQALQIMALIVALRWMGGIYRSIITGAECLVWLSGFTSIVATVRFVGVIAVLAWVGTRPTVFFTFQLIVAVLELLGLAWRARRLVPRGGGSRSLWQGLLSARHLIKFSMSLAFTSSIWVLVTQSDKLILSKVLPLSEYGYFTLAALAASGVTLITTPISNALMPRMSRLEAEGERDALLEVYRRSTQFVTVIALACALTLGLDASALLLAWTGDPTIVAHAAAVLALYAIGNGFLGISAFPYYLQYATGDLRMHVLGNAIYVVILVPLIVWAASVRGSIGAGAVWCAMNILYFLLWTPLVHRRIAPGLNRPWFARDIVAIALPLSLCGAALTYLLPAPHDRLHAALHVAVLLATMLLVGIASTSAGVVRLRGLPLIRAMAAKA